MSNKNQEPLPGDATYVEAVWPVHLMSARGATLHEPTIDCHVTIEKARWPDILRDLKVPLLPADRGLQMGFFLALPRKLEQYSARL